MNEEPDFNGTYFVSVDISSDDIPMVLVSKYLGIGGALTFIKTIIGQEAIDLCNKLLNNLKGE